jgi:hypothetical protein
MDDVDLVLYLLHLHLPFHDLLELHSQAEDLCFSYFEVLKLKRLRFSSHFPHTPLKRRSVRVALLFQLCPVCSFLRFAAHNGTSLRELNRSIDT